MLAMENRGQGAALGSSGFSPGLWEGVLQKAAHSLWPRGKESVCSLMSLFDKQRESGLPTRRTSVRPACAPEDSIYIKPLPWLLPLVLAAPRTIKRATKCHLNLCFCLKDKHTSWLLSRARSAMAVSVKLPNGTIVLPTPLVSSTELMKSLVACPEHRHSDSSLIT